MINLIAMDVYDESPTIVTIWLTIIPKISILIFLLELILGFLPNITFEFYQYQLTETNLNALSFTLKNLLLISSFLSLIIGTIVGLAQFKIKRLLAFSTISHIGFLLLALAINSEQSIESFIFYLIQYSITNLNIFLILLLFNKTKLNGYQYGYGEIEKNKKMDISRISELSLIGRDFPILGLSFSISLFSMAGKKCLLAVLFIL
jgi:NADH-ubiquinone oxidoreductase chain 2